MSRILNDGDVLPVLDGLTVVATPGHAPGHVSFWHPAKKLLITGMWFSPVWPADAAAGVLHGGRR
ncbi:MAG: hypothetical protein IPK52_13655 [Chloroflexi bacterium]|nr:hypothetical protein [Chloroflexota bacterium]